MGTYLFDIYLQDEQGQLLTDSYGYKNLGYAKFAEDYGNLVEGDGTIPQGVNPGKYKLIIAPPSGNYEYLVTYYLGCSEFTVTSIVDQDTRVDPSSGPGGTEFTISMYAKHNRQYYETLTNIDGQPLFDGDFRIVILNAPDKNTGEVSHWPVGSAWFVARARTMLSAFKSPRMTTCIIGHS